MEQQLHAIYASHLSRPLPPPPPPLSLCIYISFNFFRTWSFHLIEMETQNMAHIFQQIVTIESHQKKYQMYGDIMG